MGGMACDSTMFDIVCVVQIGTNTATPGDTVIGLMTSLLFMSYFSFLHLHTSYSPQAHLQSSHCIVTVYMLTHNVLPASPGRAQEKVNNQQQPPSMLTARLL